jgi:DnaJ-class molecular chaperone
VSWIEREPPIVECPECRGRKKLYDVAGGWVESRPCPRCRGTGRVPTPSEPAAGWPITVVGDVGEGVPADAP